MIQAKQSDLITTDIKEIGITNGEKEILSMIARFSRGEWSTPLFQRKFCWTVPQICGWIDSIISKNAIGVIVTYQLKGGGPTFIADGLQRLTATKMYLENPGQFGYSYGPEQAEKNCSGFEITVQHRIYKDHIEAMECFQKLNNGTSLTPLEFHMGELALLETCGDLIVNKVPSTVNSVERPYMGASRKPGRRNEHALMRDSYALFLQYISETDKMMFWDNTSNKADNGEPSIESILARFIRENKISRVEAEKDIFDFEKFITEQIVAINEALDSVDGKGQKIGRTTIRWLLHLAIWRKNTQRPFKSYYELIKNIFAYSLKTYGKINARLDLPNSKIKQQVILSMNGLNSLSAICRAFGSDLYDGRITRRKRTSAAIGFHASHELPFSKNGDGKTFIEPASINMSRGAQPAI